MQWLKVCLVTGRTVEQGCGKERGKISNRYFKNVAVCELNKKDMRNLEIHDGNPVRVSTEFGSVVLFAKTSRRIKVPGTAFVPYGLWVNQVLTSDTDSTGMPLLKRPPGWSLSATTRVQPRQPIAGLFWMRCLKNREWHPRPSGRWRHY